MADVVVTPQGFLRARVLATRVGIFTYRRGDGSISRELRPESEVFKEDSKKTLGGVPFTNLHPPADTPDRGMLTPETAARFSRGYTADSVEVVDQTYLGTFATVIDAETIKEILAGEDEVSCGYTCDYDETGGVWNGQVYDRIQKNIIYNHLAKVPKGRAGPNVRLQIPRLDALDAVQIGDNESEGLVKRKIGDKEFEVTDEMNAALDAMQAEQDKAMKDATKKKDKKKAKAAEEGDDDEDGDEDGETANKKADAAMAKAEAAEAKLDVAIAELARLKTAPVTDASAVQAAVKELQRVQRVAVSVLDAKAIEDLDGKSVMEIKKAVLVGRNKDFKVDGKSDAYIDNAFDFVAQHLSDTGALARSLGQSIHDAASSKAVSDGEDEVAKARKAQQERAQAGYKQPLTVNRK